MSGPLKVYVAAKYEDKVRARQVMNRLVLAGYEITYDWTTNEQVTPEQAMADYLGVAACDIFVLIAEKDLNYCGALVELGMAIMSGAEIYVIGNALDDRCIFLQIPDIHRGIGDLLATHQPS